MGHPSVYRNCVSLGRIISGLAVSGFPESLLVGDCPPGFHLWFSLSLLCLRWGWVNGLTTIIRIRGWNSTPKAFSGQPLKVWSAGDDDVAPLIGDEDLEFRARLSTNWVTFFSIGVEVKRPRLALHREWISWPSSESDALWCVVALDDVGVIVFLYIAPVFTVSKTTKTAKNY